VYLFGGLGNQLFQVARGVSMLDPGDQLECLYDRKSTRVLKNGLPEVSGYKFELQVLFSEVVLSRIGKKILNFGIRISTGNSIFTRSRFFARFTRSKTELLLGLVLKKKYEVCIANDVGLSDKLYGRENQLIVGYSQSFQYADELRRFQDFTKFDIKIIKKIAYK
jgi:hypothetical protein